MNNEQIENGARSPLVFIVVLHWNRYEQTSQCLKSVLRISYPNYKLIVVDNCSSDGSKERLEIEFPECTFLVNSANLGFARGCNTGINYAYDQGAEYVLLLNNDIEVPEDFLQPAVAAAQSDPRIGLVTGKVRYKEPRDLIWHAGGHIDPVRGQGITRGFREIDRGQYDSPGETRWASGAMMLIRRAVLEQVGFLPEEYFFGQEEWDYSTAVRKAGYRIWYVPTFVSYHAAGSSYKAGHPILIVYNAARNKQLYQQKYLPTPAWWLWRMVYWLYLHSSWSKLARWGCSDERDFQVRLKAPRLAFRDHRKNRRVEIEDLERAAKLLGPTPTWGPGWH